jgi:hypothetical protein
MSNDKLQCWVGPEFTELAPLENSISSELSYDRSTYTHLKSTDVMDILADGRDVVVKGVALTSKLQITILDALAFAYETEGCHIPVMDLHEARRAILGDL